MSKTVRFTVSLSDVARNGREAKQRAAQEARNEARFRVIEAKRRMCGKALAYVDGVLMDGGVDARSDVKVK